MSIVQAQLFEETKPAQDNHLLKLSRCDTRWTGMVVGYSDGSNTTIFGRNFCKQRDCDHNDCMDYRTGVEYIKITKYLQSFKRNNVSHVTLTFGPNQPLNDTTLDDMKHKVKLFFRQLQYAGGGKYKALVLYETKIEPNGLYHCHVHIALERSPYHTVVIKKWNQINQKTTRADIKYNTSKVALARYFARRVALAGVGIPIKDYMVGLHGRQLLNTYGIIKRTKDIQEEITQYNSNLVGTRNFNPKKKVVWTVFIGTMPKLPGEKKPPPLSEWGYI
jgi:hypothetical protein